MQAFQGYFDGKNIKALERINAKPNQKVIITVTDEYVEPEKTVSADDLFGALSEYANPSLMEMERTAWERAAVEKHAHT